jgi:hypothetical protein
MGRATFDGSHDLRPGSDGFRPLDATVVEVSLHAGFNHVQGRKGSTTLGRL